MHIPVLAAIQGLSMLSHMFHLDGSAPAPRAAAKPGGACVTRSGQVADFNSAMQLQGLLKTVGHHLTEDQRQQVGQLVHNGAAPQAIHMLQQVANAHAAPVGGPLSGAGLYAFTPPMIRGQL